MKLSTTERNLLTRATHSEGGVIEYAGISEGAAVDALAAVGWLEAVSEEKADYGRRGSAMITQHGRVALEVRDA